MTYIYSYSDLYISTLLEMYILKSHSDFPLCWRGEKSDVSKTAHRQKRNSNGSNHGEMWIVWKKQNVRLKGASCVPERGFRNGNLLLPFSSHPNKHQELSNVPTQWLSNLHTGFVCYRLNFLTLFSLSKTSLNTS